MLILTIQVDAPDGSAQAVKEHLAMYLERFGDTKVLSIKEEIPQQMRLGNHEYPGTPQRKRSY